MSLRERIAQRVSRPMFKISVAYIFIHAFMIIILDEITAFAPDENNYLAIFSGVVKGDLVFDGFAGWPTNNLRSRGRAWPDKRMQTREPVCG